MGEENVLLSVKEAAAKLSVSSRTIYRMLREGQLQGQQIRSVWRIDPVAVAAIQCRHVNPENSP